MEGDFMGSKPFSFLQGSWTALTCLLAGSAACLATAGFARAQETPAAQPTETVLHRFKGSGGMAPKSSVIFDRSGALYGTTLNGGNPDNSGEGTVFKLAPPIPPATHWTETVLYRFIKGDPDGTNPNVGLIFGRHGALYGTTDGGGQPIGIGNGTVFKLTPPIPPATGWTKTVLYAFKDVPDGALPSAALIFDDHGALYGTTAEGGNLDSSDGFGKGTVFKLTPPIPPATNWTESVLYRFKGLPDGAYPSASLIFDSDGALYGTTVLGGISDLFSELGNGTVFKLTPPVPPQTQWTKTVLYRFKGGDIGAYDGVHPFAKLIFDSHGALYGTTASESNSAHNFGTVFKLTPPAPGHTQWTETVLHRFKRYPDGDNPVAGLIFDSHGALYGTTLQGGPSGLGTVFKLTPPIPPATHWTETVLYNFNGTSPFPGKPQDGERPKAGLTFDPSGALYGTTAEGGSDFFDGGTVFKLTGF
jgi:uncharacterized repeat protein (TIGR03803 family)